MLMKSKEIEGTRIVLLSPIAMYDGSSCAMKMRISSCRVRRPEVCNHEALGKLRGNHRNGIWLVGWGERALDDIVDMRP